MAKVARDCLMITRFVAPHVHTVRVSDMCMGLVRPRGTLSGTRPDACLRENDRGFCTTVLQHQWHYVAQSLTLWREIAHDFYKLWMLAERDLLNPSNPYR